MLFCLFVNPCFWSNLLVKSRGINSWGFCSKLGLLFRFIALIRSCRQPAWVSHSRVHSSCDGPSCSGGYQAILGSIHNYSSIIIPPIQHVTSQYQQRNKSKCFHLNPTCTFDLNFWKVQVLLRTKCACVGHWFPEIWGTCGENEKSLYGK